MRNDLNICFPGRAKENHVLCCLSFAGLLKPLARIVMKPPRIIGMLCLCLAMKMANTQAKIRYSQVKIFTSHKQVAALQKSGVDIDHASYNPTEESLTTVLSEKDIRRLNTTGLRYQLLSDDEELAFLRRNKPEEFFKFDSSRRQDASAERLLFITADKSFATTITTPAAFNAGAMGGYLTFAEMKKELDSMVLNYPGLAKLDSIGRTYENRAIWSLTISDNVAANEPEPEVLFTGMHHAREPLAMENLIFFMQYLLENYAANSRIRDLVDSRRLVFIPCLNPDGYVYNQSTNPAGGGLWRKNRQPNSDGSFGQDLNRNYGYGFDYPNSGSSDVTTDANYHGDYAFQAMETQLVRDYLRLHDFHFAINYHSYGGYWIHGNTVPTYSLSATDSAVIQTTGSFATRHNFYEVGTPLETVGYNGNGTIEDWCMAGDAGIRPPVYSISPEVGAGLSTFWPAASTIIGYCKEVLFGNLQAALFGGAYADVHEKNSMALAGKSGNLDFLVRRIGSVDSAVKVTVLPLENMLSAGSPATVASLPAYCASASCSIAYTLYPSITSGQRVRFVIKTETGGITKLDTVVKFYNPSLLFNDDMESGAFSAHWSSATWNYKTTPSYSGSRCLSESPSGNYANNKTSTINTASTLDLSGATAAYLSFWTRYRSQPGYDKLQIKVSTNGSTYTALPATSTITESKGTLGGVPSLTGNQDYWVREVVDLSSVLGAAALRLRFEFTSDASVTNEGFFLDDVQVIKSTAPLITLPVRFLDVKAAKWGSEVAVKWEAVIDAGHTDFELERSADGMHFSSLYQTTDRAQAYYATDKQPLNGLNFYRIKETSLNGIQYSKTVQVFYDTDGSVTLSPNPVKDLVMLKVAKAAAGAYQVQIVAASGQTVLCQVFQLRHATEWLTVNTTGLGRGAYWLCLKKEAGDVVHVQAFSKM